MDKKTFVCCICKGTFEGYGNNPYPLCDVNDYESRCCDSCDMLVVQARIDKYKNPTLTDTDLQKKYLKK